MSLPKNFIDFTIGADPEFLCVKGASEIIRAGDVVDDPESGLIGADGNGVTFEARPQPSEDPLEVVTNIHRIFSGLVQEKPEFNSYRWIAGSHAYQYPLGGHIHFGLRGDKVSARDGTNLLSQYVGCLTLLMENKAQGQKRRGSYGGMLEYREQDYGFEYRTPASWLTSPHVAAAVLCLSKTVLFELLNNKSFDPQNRFNEDDFYRMDVDKVREKFPEIWKEITKMKLYQPLKPYIDTIHHCVVNKLNWFPKGGLKEAWGIMDVVGSVPKTQVTLETIWARYNQSLNQVRAGND
jgi:hypothetical protein